MKKNIKRFISLCFCMFFVLSMALVMPASAYNGIGFGAPAGIYGTVSGTCVKSPVLNYVLNTTTRIQTNRDSAYLVTGLAFSYTNYTTETEYFRCAKVMLMTKILNALNMIMSYFSPH